MMTIDETLAYIRRLRDYHLRLAKKYRAEGTPKALAILNNLEIRAEECNGIVSAITDRAEEGSGE